MSEPGKLFGIQKAAEADIDDFRQDLGPFVVAAETTRMPMVFTNAKVAGKPIVFVNQAFLTLTGFEEDEVLGRSFLSLIEHDSDPEALAEIQTAFEGGRDLQTQIRCCKKGGSVLWVLIFINPVRDKNGDLLQHFASFLNIDRDRELEDHLRLVLEESHYRAQQSLKALTALAIGALRGAVAQNVVDEFERSARMIISEIAKNRPDTDGSQTRNAQTSAEISHAPRGYVSREDV
ncbi:PAS domain-containing protein [Lichenifustis flavocetrariae]|uniref:PAS domain-containing protein n=1 Tax=Lichenifustis flavocetrariae TaxID=2949735 RepID=A0AA41Z352_9HYPH|nr:PAS domain-containing protein [Lichenifustis flavocetrariae]MCW6512142.1 PAS domain-containing protein [Lichenifustis flavocetrariae]